MTAFTFSTGKGSFETLSTTNSIQSISLCLVHLLHLGEAVILVAVFLVLLHQFPWNGQIKPLAQESQYF